jgi:hypothetical protein
MSTETALNMLDEKEIKATAKLALGLARQEKGMQDRMDDLVSVIKDNIHTDFLAGLVTAGSVVRHPWAVEFAKVLNTLSGDKAERDKARGKIAMPLRRACQKAELPFTLGMQLSDDEKPAGFTIVVASAAGKPSDDMIALAAALLMACKGNKKQASTALAIAGSAAGVTVTEEQLQEVIEQLFPVDLGPMVVDQVNHVAQWAARNIH